MGASQALDILRQLQGQIGSGDAVRQGMEGLVSVGLGPLKPKKFFRTPLDEQILRQQLMQTVLGGLGFTQQLPTGGGDPFTGGFDISQFFPSPPVRQLSPEFGEITATPSETITPKPATDQVGGLKIPSLEDIAKPISVSPGTQAQLPVGATVLGAVQNPDGLPGILFDAGQSAIDPGSGFASGVNPAFQLGQSGLPALDPTTQAQINNIYNAQLGAQQLSFGEKRQALLNDLFGRGVNASTIATDAGGRLLYGQSQIENDILGQKSAQELALRQQLLQSMLDKQSKFGGFGGGGGSGGIGVARDTSSLDPLTFEQKLQLAKLGLDQEQVRGQLGLGGKELDIRQQLGLGDLSLGKSGQQQQLLQFILGQGLSRQQGAAGLAGADASRLTGFLSDRERTLAGLGQSQAQIEAQRRGLLSSILGGAASIGGALLGGGGLGSLFKP